MSCPVDGLSQGNLKECTSCRVQSRLPDGANFILGLSRASSYPWFAKPSLRSTTTRHLHLLPLRDLAKTLREVTGKTMTVQLGSGLRCAIRRGALVKQLSSPHGAVTA